MDLTLFYLLLAVFLVSLVSFVGVLVLSWRKALLQKFIGFFVAFSAGTLLAAAFLELIPESYVALGNFNFVLVGIAFFFITEALIHWHHGHDEVCEDCIHPVAYLNIIGDGFHNFIDGLIISASFLTSIPLGIATTIAIVFHEIPQEIGDFAVLIKSGMKKSRAVFFNFISALASVAGGILGYFFLRSFESFTPYALAISAGGLIYIATADLFPELHKERRFTRILFQIISVLIGIILIALLGNFFPG